MLGLKTPTLALELLPLHTKGLCRHSRPAGVCDKSLNATPLHLHIRVMYDVARRGGGDTEERRVMDGAPMEKAVVPATAAQAARSFMQNMIAGRFTRGGF